MTSLSPTIDALYCASQALATIADSRQQSNTGGGVREGERKDLLKLELSHTQIRASPMFK